MQLLRGTHLGDSEEHTKRHQWNEESRGGWVGELPASKWYQGQEVSVFPRADKHCPLFPLRMETQDPTEAEQLAAHHA